MEIIKSPVRMQNLAIQIKKSAKTIGLVPTMGWDDDLAAAGI